MTENCEHDSVELVGGLGVCNGCGKAVVVTGMVPVQEFPETEPGSE